VSRISTATASAIAILLCGVTISITGLNWLVSGDKLRFAVALVALLLTVLAMRFIRDSHLHEAGAVVIALLLTAHVVLGMQLELYETSVLYDKAMHVIGLAAIAGILIAAINSYCERCGIQLPLGLLVTMVFGGALSVGTLWEFFEFGIDSTGLFNAQRGLQDTMLDLIADAIGAVLAIGLFVAMNWSREQQWKRRGHKLIAKKPHPSIDGGHKVGSKSWKNYYTRNSAA